MVGTFSPHGDAGGTLHFPSPTHIRHVGASSAFKQLRRSLSRSPSKGSAFRLVSSKSTSPISNSPLSPNREFTPTRSLSATVSSHTNIVSPSPLITPHHSSARKSRQPNSRTSSRNPSHSPKRKTLAELSDQGNSTPHSSGSSSDGIENRSVNFMGELPSESDSKFDTNFLHVGQSAPNAALTRLEKGNRGSVLFGAKSSPLKRSDGVMNRDHGSMGSPSAKRRSLHGASFSPDFNIFDHESSLQNNHQLLSERSSFDGSSATDHQPLLSPLPKRTSSLRRTTLQQRHDKPTFARSKLNTDMASEFSTPGHRFRMSLDSNLPAMPRDSPFSSQGSLPNASAHPMSKTSANPSTSTYPNPSQRHPLSRTMTQSSSNSSMAEDSPTHIPFRLSEHRRPVVDFNKSLPVGSARPASSGHESRDTSSQESSTQGSFATPENYRLAKPLPAAFMSTGLISKRNKNVEDPHIAFNVSAKEQMPDTPCKRHSVIGSTTPAPLPDLSKSRQVRHSFGTPSTPFNPHASRPAQATFAKGVSIFGSGFNAGGTNRRGSFASVDGDENSQASLKIFESQSSTDGILATPTKQASVPGCVSNRTIHQTPEHGSGLSRGADAESPVFDSDCKSIHFGTPSGSADGDSDHVMDDSPSAALRFRSYSNFHSSFHVSRSSRNNKSPTPLTKTFHTAPARLKSPRTKSEMGFPASPIQSLFDRLPPQTPREGEMPPDPSRLSISAQTNGPAIQPMHSMLNSSSIFAPATPTTSRDSTTLFGKSRSTLGSSTAIPLPEADASLMSRFDRVELIGTGEFSFVYRVKKSQESRSNRGYFALPPSNGSPNTPLPDRVWAVKKSRQPYLGVKDRQRKLQEARTLRALGRSDHILQLFDSWEDKGHLYIQTEFCEEGSLDMFLDQVGRKARLDDFRIWKILLELSLGLKHVHDSGFIHLDLKPANILVTFEGVLKLADFGMAAHWPASPGIDGEGDREYIGPEILRGQFDKPGDVFALGLIMLEIAGNVMLPDNGASWQRLRTGDMSDVPSLTCSSENSNILRDSAGKPITPDSSVDDFYGSDSINDECRPANSIHRERDQRTKSQPQTLRTGELLVPPIFMVDAANPQALDNIVRWMISPETAHRPVISQVLSTTGVQWVATRRRAGATIFEGNWGPADDVLADDAEMIDV
ncbi:MAG: hypothetical protein L6R41_003258 [Letrouitia leprolyta]|nr:MAG: hypothetical protein L6R41_003258 [Letrouitia leprolyta]